MVEGLSETARACARSHCRSVLGRRRGGAAVVSLVIGGGIVDDGGRLFVTAVSSARREARAPKCPPRLVAPVTRRGLYDGMIVW